MSKQILLTPTETAVFNSAVDKVNEAITLGNLMIEKAKLAQDCEFFRLFAERGYNLNDYDVTRQQDGGLLLTEKAQGEDKE